MTNELYDSVRKPLDMDLIDKLLDKYFSLSYDEMTNVFAELSKQLYDKINIISKDKTDIVNSTDYTNLISKINSDFIAAGKPYDPQKHNGMINPLALMPGWCVFRSWDLLGTEKISGSDTSHRFYFALPNSKLYEFADVLYDKLKKENIPFYFKTDMNDGVQRTDNLVLYTSNKFLKQTMKVIDELQKERIDLIKTCAEPSILVGNYSNKIGYASENSKIKESYTSLMCKTFISTMEQALRLYISNNPSSQVRLLYHKKIDEYVKRGLKINDNVKNRVLLDILVQNVPSFKQQFLDIYKNELIKKGIDINNVCFNKQVKDELDKMNNGVINLPNGTKLSREEYVRINKIDSWIQKDAKVKLKNGNIVSGEEFTEYILSVANQFNSFQELMLSIGAQVIDRGFNQERIDELKKIREEYQQIMSDSMGNEALNDRETMENHLNVIHR